MFIYSRIFVCFNQYFTSSNVFVSFRYRNNSILKPYYRRTCIMVDIPTPDKSVSRSQIRSKFLSVYLSYFEFLSVYFKYFWVFCLIISDIFEFFVCLFQVFLSFLSVYFRYFWIFCLIISDIFEFFVCLFKILLSFCLFISVIFEFFVLLILDIFEVLCPLVELYQGAG